MIGKAKRPVRPIIVILSGPSACGKTRIRNELLKDYPFTFVVSSTTRAPREDEVNGVDYDFISCGEFLAKIAAGEFEEYEQINDKFYGTPALRWHLDKGTDLLLDVDVNGCEKLAHIAKLKPHLLTIFIVPRDTVNFTDISERLYKRKNITIEEVHKRLRRAPDEILRSVNFDHRVVNGHDFEATMTEIRAIIDERLGRVVRPVLESM